MTEEQKNENQEQTTQEEQEEKKAQEEQQEQEEKQEQKKEENNTENTSDRSKQNQEKSEPQGKFKDLIKQIESLSALELAELVKELEERFGVSATQLVAVAGVGSTAQSTATPETEEKSMYTIVLSAAGEKKIEVIKAVREINPDLGLKEAKDLVDNPPKEIKKDVPKEEAEEVKKKLESAGATVELK